MKKIAIFQDDLGLGGIQRSLINLLSNIDLNKYEIDLYLFSNEQFFDVKLDERINIIEKKPFFKGNKFVPFSILRRIYKNDIEEEYDIAIDFNSYKQETAFYASTVKAKKRYILVHNDIVLKRKNEWRYRVLFAIFKSKYKYFDKFIGVSRGALYSLNETLKRPKKEGFILPNIIDTNVIKKRMNEDSKLKVDSKNYNLVTMGRLCHQKGFDILIDLMSKVKRKDIKLYIIGSGPDEAMLRRRIAKYKLEDKIILLGALKNVFSVLKLMDGFILTSRYEGQGMVILEAKAVGLKIFIPKHLEKYNENIFGYKNLLKEIEKAKRAPKAFNALKSYNEKILKEFDRIVEEK